MVSLVFSLFPLRGDISSSINLTWPYHLSLLSYISCIMFFCTFINYLILVLLLLSIRKFLESLIQKPNFVVLNLCFIHILIHNTLNKGYIYIYIHIKSTNFNPNFILQRINSNSKQTKQIVFHKLGSISLMILTNFKYWDTTHSSKRSKKISGMNKTKIKHIKQTNIHK